MGLVALPVSNCFYYVCSGGAIAGFLEMFLFSLTQGPLAHIYSGIYNASIGTLAFCILSAKLLNPEVPYSHPELAPVTYLIDLSPLASHNALWVAVDEQSFSQLQPPHCT